MSGVPTKPMIMFTVVRPTLTMKLAHTAALLMRLLYRPHSIGPRKAPARAPQGGAHELGDQVTEALVLEHGGERRMATKTTSSARIQTICFASRSSP